MGLLSQDQCCLFWNIFCFTLWPQHLCGSKKPLSVLFQWHLLFLLICSDVRSLMALVYHVFNTPGSYVRYRFRPLGCFGQERLFLPFLQTSSQLEFCCCNYMIVFSLSNRRFHEIVLGHCHLWIMCKSFLGTKTLKFPKVSYEM